MLGLGGKCSGGEEGRTSEQEEVIMRPKEIIPSSNYREPLDLKSAFSWITPNNVESP